MLPNFCSWRGWLHCKDYLPNPGVSGGFAGWRNQTPFWKNPPGSGRKLLCKPEPSGTRLDWMMALVCGLASRADSGLGVLRGGCSWGPQWLSQPSCTDVGQLSSRGVIWISTVLSDIGAGGTGQRYLPTFRTEKLCLALHNLSFPAKVKHTSLL